MRVIIFAGPSLRAADRTGPEFRPPAQQGDVYLAVQSGAQVIGIIDGYFDSVPAVWHKEILWALSRGIAVFGAASMGALRAAELDQFGMIGIGRIYQDFRDGRLCDDDEVAMLHGPEAAGYPALSEPMVNIRATLARAQEMDVLDATSAHAVLTNAKSQFYQQRSWDSALAALTLEIRETFSAWLPLNRLDQKREDALDLLRAVARHVAASSPPAAPNFSFESTENWANASWRSATDGAATPDDTAILDELRLEGAPYLQIRHEALLLHLAEQNGVPQAQFASVDIAATTLAFRLPRGLLRQADLARWAAQNGLTSEGFTRLMTQRAALESMARDLDPVLRRGILDQLRLQGRYPALSAKAKAKPDPDGLPLPPRPMLLIWYFETRLGREIPDDLTGYATNLGFPNLERFHMLVACEYAYVSGGASPAAHIRNATSAPR